MASLDRAVALPQGQDSAIAVSEHLDLDVTRVHESPLHVEAAVAEVRLRLRRRSPE